MCQGQRSDSPRLVVYHRTSVYIFKERTQEELKRPTIDSSAAWKLLIRKWISITKQPSYRKIDAYSNSAHSSLANPTSKERLIEDTKKKKKRKKGKRRNAHVCVSYEKRWKTISKSGNNIALQSDLVLFKATDGPMYINSQLKSQIK